MCALSPGPVIHNIKKPSEALRSQVFVFQAVVKVIKGQRAGRGQNFAFRPTTKGILDVQRAQCPQVDVEEYTVTPL